MFIKVFNSILIIFIICVCSLNAKTITAKSYDNAIHKIQKRESFGSIFDYIAIQRKYLLSHNSSFWYYDDQKSDTIYVCDVIYLNSSSYNEYIITPERTYSLENVIGKSLMCKVLSDIDVENAEDFRYINYVRNWDVDLFKRWNTTTINDFTYVNAIRIIRLSKHRYKYDYYSFCDNYWEENDPIPIDD